MANKLMVNVKVRVGILLLLLFSSISLITILSEHDKENYSNNYTNAIHYRITADTLDLKALNTYPQKIKKINSLNPYNIDLLVQNTYVIKSKPVKYKAYHYDKAISQYLEPTEIIQTDTKNVIKISESFLSEGISIQEIAKRALIWNKKNISYDRPLADREYRDIKKTRDAENTIVLRKGACTEYANVFVALMRHLRVPARIVIGFYQVPERGYHAWAEYYLKGYGWIPVETQLGRVGVPNSYIKLFVGKDPLSIGFEYYKINAHCELIK